MVDAEVCCGVWAQPQTVLHQAILRSAWGSCRKQPLLISTCWLLLGRVMCAVYHQLKTAVEKSDAWRYHVLCGHGGIYTDTDTICAKPFEQWINFNTTPEPGLIVGIENRFYSQQEAEEASYVHKIQVLAFPTW